MKQPALAVHIKNIGMGCGSRAGKMQQHASGKPAINEELCRGCRRCAKECGSDAITYLNKKAVIDYDKCKRLRTLHRSLQF